LSISPPCMDYMHGMGFAAWLVWAFSTSIFCIIGILYIDDKDLLAIVVCPSESTMCVLSYASNDLPLERIPLCHWQRLEPRQMQLDPYWLSLAGHRWAMTLSY
jgi:hypothetical protein